MSSVAREVVFTIKRAGVLRNRFRVRMVAGNNEMVWYSQTYSRKQTAHAAIEFIKANAVYARTLDQT